MSNPPFFPPRHAAGRARMRRLAHVVRTLVRAGGLDAARTLARGLHGTLVQVENTNYCNFHCRYCVTHSRDSLVRVPRGHMSLATFETILARHPRAVMCVIQGQGEPLLDPTLFDKIAHARSRGILTQVISNGSMLRPEMIERLRHEGPDLLLVSIDLVAPARMESMREGLDYPRVYRAIAELTRARTRARPMVVGLMSILHGPFDAEAEVALRSFASLGIDVVLYKQLNAAYGERIEGYRTRPAAPIPARVARALPYLVHHQDPRPIAPCAPLAHDMAYYLWDGQRTACCILNEPRYAAPQYSRDALLTAYAARAMPSPCTRCSFFTGYRPNARVPHSLL